MGFDETTGLSDGELIERSRAGDMRAYAALWNRHAAAGRKVARLYTSASDPDDLVSEAYVIVLQVLRRGGGPRDGFRPYLFTVIRNLAKRWGARRTEAPVETIEELPSDIDVPADQEHSADREMVGAAFAALPERWRTVLWYTEVEGLSPAEIAPMMQIAANSVAALAYRAREGLRQAWLQEHVRSAQAEGECAWALSKVGEHTRDGLGKRDAARMDAHLSACKDCRDAALDVAHIGGRLGAVIAGVVLGGGGTAWLVGGAPAPSAVAAGAVVAGTGSGVAAGAAAGAGAVATPGALLAAGAVVAALALGGVTAVVTTSTSSPRAEAAGATAVGATDGDAAAAQVASDERTRDRNHGAAPRLDDAARVDGITAVDEPTVAVPLEPDVHPGLPAEPLDEVTDAVSSTVNTVADTAGRLVSTLTGGRVRVKAEVDLSLGSPKVTVHVGGTGDGGLDVAVDDGVHVGATDDDGNGLRIGIGGGGENDDEGEDAGGNGGSGDSGGGNGGGSGGNGGGGGDNGGGGKADDDDGGLIGVDVDVDDDGIGIGINIGGIGIGIGLGGGDDDDKNDKKKGGK